MLNNLKKSCVFIVLIAATSCAHKKAEMLPDGKTWQIWVRDIQCGNDDNECQKKVKAAQVAQGAELCGKAPARIFSCTNKITYSTVNSVCFVSCD